MKKLILSAALALVSFGALAGTSFTSKLGSTNTVVPNTNTVLFPSSSGKQLVIYNVAYRNATNAQLQFATGEALFTQTATNTSTGITNQVNSTNGFTPGSLLVLEHNDTAYIAPLVSIGQATNGMGTNIVLAAGGWGVAPSIGDRISQLGTETTLILGAGTNTVSGNAVFVGNPGRPVVIRLGPAITPSYLQVVGEYQ